MLSDAPAAYDCVLERRRAVALARHFRQAEGLSIAQIAERLDRSPATIKAYFYDPTGEKARAVKARYVGVCRGCGAYTQPRNGKGDAYAYCKRCHPGAIERRWTRELVISAMLKWRSRYGRLPSSYDWSRTHAHRRGGEALTRLACGGWPAASVVSRLFGTWAAARTAALGEDWVDEGMPSFARVEEHYELTTWPAVKLLGRMAHCTDVMPGLLCDDLELERGSTYARAAQWLLAERKRLSVAS